MDPIKKITGIFQKLNPFDAKQNTQKGRVYPNKLSLMYEMMRIEEDRKKAYEECWVMYVQDPRVSAAIDTTAGSATTGGFSIKFNNITENSNKSVIEDAESIIDKTIKKTKLQNMISGIAKEMLILGDVFLEVVINHATMDIVNLKKLPARTIERVEDEFGTLLRYEQKDELNQVIATFEPWQILHMRWNHFSGQKYGISMLRSVRGHWKKLKMLEEDLVIRRRTRAGVKMHHYGADPSNPLEPDEVDEYIKTNQSSPLNVRTDWYSNGKWKIDVLKSDDGVGEIKDVKHIEDILFMGIRTPKGLLGIGADSNRSNLERQEVAYIRLLNEVNDEIGEQFKGLFDLAIQLKGLNPEQLDYELVWSEKTIENVNTKAERLLLLRNANFISTKTGSEEMGYNFDDEQKKIEEERTNHDQLDYLNAGKLEMPKMRLGSLNNRKEETAHNGHEGGLNK